MDTYLLQPWATISGTAATVTSVTQPSADWLDLGHARDVVLFLQVSEKLNESRLRYETSPTRDNAQFKELTNIIIAPTTTPVVTRIILGAVPAVPFARWLRWRLTWSSGAGNWDASFRISVFAYRR